MTISLNPKDLEIDAYRPAVVGAGPVRVYSAVKVTHLPTQLTAISQHHRSQSRNKEICLAMLQAGIEQLR